MALNWTLRAIMVPTATFNTETWNAAIFCSFLSIAFILAVENLRGYTVKPPILVSVASFSAFAEMWRYGNSMSAATRSMRTMLNPLKIV
jgi:hypothetical protein